MTPDLLVAQLAAAAVCGIALAKLLVELASGGVAMVARRIRGSALGMNTASAPRADGGYACRDTATLAARAGACPPPVQVAIARRRFGSRGEVGR